ncbi:formylglycine-generating enzyme family protein [Xanthomarina gelatinilytica]|uniref:formylglycine-generating enzyme family protein n=1 Tax=Xanthomarina gelatinilytica TaxID=1137281 RepID=UPI003AA7D033
MKTKIKIIFILFILLSVDSFSQLNIPAHFTYVKGGTYKEFSLGTSKVVYQQKIEPFYMYRFEVSGIDYQRFLKATNRKINNQIDLKRPIVNVSYSDAINYCSWLSKVYGISFRLPTNEEWELAARGGNFENNNFVYNKKLPNEHIVYKGNSGTNRKSKCTSCMQPNELGLHGMVGNVWEWTEQQLKGFDTFVVGGSFLEDAGHVKVTTKKAMNMDRKQKDIGFRMVVNAKEFEIYLKNKK